MSITPQEISDKAFSRSFRGYNQEEVDLFLDKIYFELEELPGILTGAILALARAAGETAAVMYTGTVFFTQKDGVSLFEPVMALPYHVYVMATSGTNIEGTRHLQYGTSLVLVALVFLMSLGAIILRERRRSR